MLGIALGVTVLITVLSVMNGFDEQIQLRIFDAVPHIRITDEQARLGNWKELMSRLSKYKGILGQAPYINGQALLTSGDQVHPVLIQGILPSQPGRIFGIEQHMVAGNIQELTTKPFGIILGRSLAFDLGVMVGDRINVIVPSVSMSPLGTIPRFKRFLVVGIFSLVSGFGYDSNYAYINLTDAQKLYHFGSAVTGIQLRTKDIFSAIPIANTIQKKLGFDYQVYTWADQFGAFYHAVQMEKTIMFLILLMLIAIAAFSLVSSLVMLVNDKKSDIAILRTFGATPRLISQIFVVQGFFVGFIGTSLGVLAGILLSLHITKIANWIQQISHTQLINANVYFVDYLPSKLMGLDIWHVILASLGMSFLATLYPAWRAAKILPAEALRYE
jgi:lipoprotein-releasing system permease protein